MGEGQRGLSPAASKIYAATSPLSFGGYGEAVYTNEQGAAGNATGSGLDRADFLRMVLYVGYRFNDKWLLNSEFELEHGTTSTGPSGSSGSYSVEFAYLEYLANDEVSFRFGLLLMPLGFVNELHEPTLFPSVGRPFLESAIIPTTFRENGLGIVGENEQIAYRAYLTNGLDARGFSASGLRGGRQKGGQALAEDISVTGRLDYIGVDGLTAGVSILHGNSGQGLPGISARTTITDVHVEYQTGGLRGRALGVIAELNDVAALNALAAPMTDSIGEKLRGYYLELLYNVLNGQTEQGELMPFVRFEKFDTQAEVPVGATKNPIYDQEIWTWGVAYKPHPNLVFKADYVDRANEAKTASDLFRLGFGFVF